MAKRSITVPGNITFRYGVPSLSALGFLDNTSITAVNINIVDATGTTLLASTAMTYVAANGGYTYTWNPGTALNGKNWAQAFMTPTSSKPFALVQTHTDELDITDANAGLVRADGVESGLSHAHSLQAIFAVCSAVAAGLDTTNPAFRNYLNTKNRITGTDDQFGNRPSVTFNFD